MLEDLQPGRLVPTDMTDIPLRVVHIAVLVDPIVGDRRAVVHKVVVAAAAMEILGSMNTPSINLFLFLYAL